MKLGLLILLAILLISVIILPVVYNNHAETEPDFFFGVSFGGTTADQAKLLIDKVKGYTNFFIINSWEVVSNSDDSVLNEISQYAVDSGMYFMVYFDFVSQIVYPWHQTWLDNAEEKFGDKFLGVYLFDEPGGKQVDTGHWKNNTYTKSQLENVVTYSDARELFLEDIAALNSTKDVKRRNLPMFTSDYALYWFDYLAGYDSIFVELGWNQSRNRQISLCRGAANVQDKDWGAIVTWTYYKYPYLVDGPAMLQDFITAYLAGAKYVTVLNYPYNSTYGILQEDQFSAMETFWHMTSESEFEPLQKVDATVAFVLPEDYGWGLRHQNDKIWFPEWGPDELSSEIWEKLNTLIEKHGLALDIIYDDSSFDFEDKYSMVYYWNSNIG